MTVKLETTAKRAFLDNIIVTNEAGSTPTPTCADPEFSPVAGDYYTAQNVELSCTTPGAIVHYSTTSNEGPWMDYSQAIPVSTTTTIWAYATATDYNPSSVVSATYNILPTTFNQDWEGNTNGWTFVSVTGEQVWSVAVTSGNHYAKMSGYASSANHENEDWCISPAFDLSEYTNPVLTFKTAKNYDGNDLVVYFSNNYDGQNLATANWQELECTLSPGGNNWTFVESGNIDLSSFSGSECYIGFKYTSTTSAAATWEVDDIVLAELEPSITVSKQSLNGFTYVVENGPSAAQSFTVSGENLTANISLSLGNDSNFEICETEDGTYTNSLTLTQNNGAVSSTTIYVRLKSGLSINTYEGTITLTSTDADDKTVALSGSVTEPILDYATLPFAYDGNALETPLPNGLTQEGLTKSYSSSPKIQFNDTDDCLILHFDERPGTLSFAIKGNGFSGGTFKVQTSEDGTTYTDLAIYDSDNMPTSVQSKEFNNLGENVRYIKWIYTNKSSGNVALGAITLAQYVAPTGPTVNIGTLTHVTSLEMWYFDSDVVDINDGDEVESGTEVFVQPTAESGYSIESVTVFDASDNEVNVIENSGNWSFIMPNSSVTINATATESSVTPVTGDKYVKVTSTTDLTSGQYLIVYEEESLAFDGSLTTLDAASNTIAVTLNNNEIAVIDATSAAEFTIDVTEGIIKSASGYYIGRTENSNGMNTSATEAYTNTISIDEDGNADVVASGGAYLRYNATSGQDRFRYFKSATYTSQQAIQLYKKVEATPAGPSITVNGYGNTDGGYVLLAWPESTSPANIEGMISDDYGAQLTPETPGTYDLYYYDESQEKEWRNYRTNSFNLVPGKGYLYASKEGVTLTYEGEANPDFDDVDNLPYTENDLVKSIYLAGNSKTNEQTFYVYNSGLAKQTFNYLTMNEDGDGFISGQGAAYTAPAMTGFFVQAPGAGMTLSTENLEDVVNVSSLNINVLRDRGSVIDNAIVSFSNGSMMDKFYLKNNTTRVYIPQGNREMAIANSAAEAEMPVSFRASENGTYTLAVEAENVEMNYLHLIDNLTGMDVDLLQTPSYTFEAKTSDYASRFRLVFKANGTNENNAETFAYFNGTNWTVSNVGDATLQVVDVTGRTVANQLINGNAELNLNQPAGVYVIRLVNGDNVKTQKVVVR